MSEEPTRPESGQADVPSVSEQFSEDSLQTLRTRIKELEGQLKAQRNDSERVAAPAERTVRPLPTQSEEIEDAASILEYLAWGRIRPSDLNERFTRETAMRPAARSDPHENCEIQYEPLLEGLRDSRLAQISFLQLLLPSHGQIQQIVDWHIERLLWYHNSFHAPTFQRQLDDFISRHGCMIDHNGVNLQWVALLFAALGTSMLYASDDALKHWGFRESEQQTLSRRWFMAVLTCLNLSYYTANHSVYSIQAICTNAVATHMMGFSNSQAILLATAIRLSQSLGLHRLDSGASGSIMELETGRRLWSQMCIQDWFSIPFSETYEINPLYTTSIPPRNCNDDDFNSVFEEHVPTITSFTRLQTKIASIMPHLQDDLMSSNTPYTKYEAVLKHDQNMRTIIAGRPSFLTTNVSNSPSWPKWVPWARRAATISLSHKIIMIHRNFLGASFTNPVFSFTRRASVAAAKTIMKEFKASIEEGGPVIWTSQAFAIAACIIMCLDLLHRTPNEKGYNEDRVMVEDCIVHLRGFKISFVATRGVRLLDALIAQAVPAAPTADHPADRKRKADQLEKPPQKGVRKPVFDLKKFIKDFRGQGNVHSIPGATDSVASHQAAPLPLAGLDMPMPDGPDIFAFDMSMDPMFRDTMAFTGYSFGGVDASNSFDNLQFLANMDFTNF